jgi:hypothetical protein
MHKERLEQMVVMLRGLPPEKRSNFDIGEWSCGTSACAVGTACFDPWFNEQGLHLNEYGGPSFKDWTSWDAVEAFFGMDPSDARDLFYGGNYPKGDDTTPAEVANRIEAFIAA